MTAGRTLRSALVWGAVAWMVAAVSPSSAHENAVVHRGLAHWSVDVLGNPFYTPTFRTEVGNGSDQEDVPATRSLGHFYNPQTNSAPSFAFGSGPATDNSQDQYDAAISAYLANNLVGTDAAFHRMGRALHFVQDMTSPAHTHDDDHALGDDFEGWGPANFPPMNFSAVAPKFASPPTAEGFVREIAQLIYDQTVYQAVLYENASLTQPNSVFKEMFPSLHFESGGFFFDDHFEIDRIGDWGCDLGCADDWWIPDELLTTDSGGPGGATRHTGAAYIENTGGDGGPVVPVVFGGQPNTADESILQIYARLLYPEAIAYGAGLLQVFANAVGAPPIPTATATQTSSATVTLTPLPTATATDTATATQTLTAMATHTATPASTATATRTPVSTATASATVTPTATLTLTRTTTTTPTIPSTPTLSPSPTMSATPSVSTTPSFTPTATAAPLCATTPRSDCGTPSTAGKSQLQLRDSSSESRDKLKWRWSKGSAHANQFGDPAATTDYALCVYDRSGGVAELVQVAAVPAGEMCGGAPCWKPLSRGYRYKNRAANDDGVQTVLLKEGLDNTAKLQVKGKGLKLDMAPSGDSEYLDQDPAVTVQLVNSVGFCWQATYSAPAQRNQPGLFDDRSD